jgi:hypothetical protein
MIQIQIMPRSFFGKGVTPLIRIYGMFGQKRQMLLVKNKHLGWQEVYRQFVDFTVTVKPPAKASLRQDHAKHSQEDCTHVFFGLGSRF